MYKEVFMGFFVLLILISVIVVIVSASSSGKESSAGYYGDYICDNDDEYENFETGAAMGVRDYFTDDSVRDYNSYYAQVADDAMMGDESAMEELRGEFGDGEL